MNKKTKIIGVIVVNVVLGVFILECVKEKVDDFNQSPTKQMWDLYNESEKISKTPLKELLNKEITNTTIDEVYLRLCDLCEYGYELDQINDYQINFWLFIILMVKQEMVVLNNSFTIAMIKSILLYKLYKMFIWKTVHAI